jgi:predicted nucleic acid-binding protein
MSRFVLDASVTLTWCFPDENAQLAGQIADRFRRGDVAIAPAFWPHEVLNALLSAEKRKRISAALTKSFLHDLATLPVRLEPVSSQVVFDRIESLSRAYGLTAYDAAYLGLAMQHDLPLATLDSDLVTACGMAKVELVR